MITRILPSSWSGPILSLLRIVAGLLFFAHGTSKYFNFPATDYFKDGVALFSLMGLAGLLELIGGALVTVGLFTHIAAFILSGEMAVAYFMAHAPHSLYPLLNGGEAAVLFCFVFLYLAAQGAGPWSLDAKRA